MFPTPRTRILPAAAFAALTFVVGFELGGAQGDVDQEGSILLEARERIRSLALRPPSEGALAREGVRGMLQALDDDYAAYLPAAVQEAGPEELARRGLGLADASAGHAGVHGKLLEDGVGYVGLRLFAPGAGDRVREEVAGLVEDGAGGIVLDLRGNPGGMVSEAVEVGAVFLGEEPIVLQETADGLEEARRASRPAVGNLALVVLVDGRTASAAELVAGAVQDHDVGLVVGERTKGKATVQQIVPLGDGSAVKLTTGMYRTPLGRRVDGGGIRPDVRVDSEVDEDAPLDRASAILGADGSP